MYLSDLQALKNADCLLYFNGRTAFGGLIKVGGTEYRKGVVTHPGYKGPSELTYNIENMGFETFYAVFGKDASAGAEVGGDNGIKGTRTRTKIYVDGVLSDDSGNLKYPETYTVTVNISGAKELKLVTSDGGDGIYCDTSAYADAMLLRAGEEISLPPEPESPPQDISFSTVDKAYLSDMTVGRNKCFGSGIGIDCNPHNEYLCIDTTFYDKGLCLIPFPVKPAYAEYNIEGLGFRTLSSYIGICYSEITNCNKGSVICRIYGDGKLIYESPLIRAKENGVYSKPVLAQADVTEVQLILIEVDPTSDGNDGDMVCFGEAVLVK